jgi:hypothetical protein
MIAMGGRARGAAAGNGAFWVFCICALLAAFANCALVAASGTVRMVLRSARSSAALE